LTNSSQQVYEDSATETGKQLTSENTPGLDLNDGSLSSLNYNSTSNIIPVKEGIAPLLFQRNRPDIASAAPTNRPSRAHSNTGKTSSGGKHNVLSKSSKDLKIDQQKRVDGDLKAQVDFLVKKFNGKEKQSTVDAETYQDEQQQPQPPQALYRSKTYVNTTTS
jgi:hypothetical protein